MFEFPQKVKDFCSFFKKNNYEIYAVGGCVRDAILNKSSDDIDFCTNATPKEMLSIFPHAIKTGIKHGTLTIPFKGEYYEVTTYRIDGEYHDGRHPDSVSYSRSLKEDLSRRDFTINAMAYDVDNDELVDIFGGVDDLDNGIIRTVGDPLERFSEDALRMLRAIRFESKLGFKIDEKTFDAIMTLKDNIKNVSSERIRTEFLKTIASDHATKGLSDLSKTGLLSYILPYLNTNDLKPSSALFDLNLNAKTDPITGLTAILIRTTDDIKNASLTALHLKLSNTEAFRVTHLFDAWKKHPENMGTPYGKRAFLSILKREYFDEYFALLDALNVRFDTVSLKRDFESYLSSPLSISELDISGNDLIGIGLSGKEVGDALKLCLDEILNNPYNNHKIALLNYVKKEYNI